ncbi:MAG: branched-chain amino acid transport system substrate-binding protein [Hyphomicrobiales bacterium]|jgi:branched-chain amino acid transport system substrate-binding protein|nr:branched-chain amino acid transport system substrate-binding protein [Hyphomicrobiales bacterium]
MKTLAITTFLAAAARRCSIAGLACTALSLTSTGAFPQETVKIGLVLPLSGPLADVGRQAQAGAKLYMELNGGTLAGKKVELVVKDDQSTPDKAVALARELVVNDKAAALGVALTSSALAIAPFATQAKTATVLVASPASISTDRSIYFVRASYTLGQPSRAIAEWAFKNGSKKAAVIRSMGLAGIEAGAEFADAFTRAGGTITEPIDVPFTADDLTPFLLKVRSSKPDTVFAFVLPRQAVTLAKQFAELDLAKEGIKLIGPGEIVDEDILPQAGETMVGLVTAGVYSALHDSPVNKRFVEAFRKANQFRPNVVAVAAYDGMHLIYEALKKTGGKTDGDALVEAMKGMKWESPRGPVSIDARTRNMTQNIYLRKVEKVQNEYYNLEFQTVAAVSSEPPLCCVPQTCSNMNICSRAQ